MIDKRQWSHLSGLMLTATKLVDGLYAGGHASRRFGSGLEFHDYRPYVPGDDPATVDWKLFGRTDRYYIKRYQRYTDLHLYLLVDGSASMHYAGAGGKKPEKTTAAKAASAGSGGTKFEYAQQLAAALAFLAVRQANRVGLGVFAAGLRHHLPVAGSWGHLLRVIQTLERARPTGAADIGRSIAEAHAQLSRRGLMVIISDFLDEPAGLFDGLNRLRHARFDVAALQVLTPPELDLNRLGARRMQLVDLESRSMVATDVRSVQARYASLLGAHLDRVRAGCIGRGVDHELATTDKPVLAALRSYLTRRV